MPLYEFKCKKCGFEFENLQKFNDPPPPCPCPKEGEGTTRCEGPSERQISRSSFQLKGSGWYATDYKNT